MTEKRFYIRCDEYNAWSVHEKNKDMIVFDLFKSDAELICNKLNKQYETIQRLDEKWVDEHSLNETLRLEIQRLEAENKILLGLITEILDFIEDNNGVSLDEMKKFWKSKEKELEYNDC